MQEVKIQNLVLNVLTQEQFEGAEKDASQLYLTPDTTIDSSEKGVANGVASLDTNGKVHTEQIPIATTSTLGGVKPDGNTITVTEDGTISATGGSGSGFDFEGTKAEFDAAVAAGTITDDSVSLITDDVSGDNVATKAELQDRVAKAGDTMTGQLKMSGENEVRFGTDDNYYLVQCSGNGQLSIFNKNGKGIFLQLEEAHAPFYWNGTNGYRLLTTADLPSSAGSVGFPNLSAPVSYSANVSFTVPANGWVWTRGYFSAAGGQTVTGTLNGKSFIIGYNNSSTWNFDSPLWFPVAKGDVWLCNRDGFFYPMR